MDRPDCRFWISVFLMLTFFSDLSHSQRIYLSPTTNPTSPSPVTAQSGIQPAAQENSGTSILKVYPDGTQKVVPLEALNFRDDGQAYGGPPRLSLFQGMGSRAPAESPGRLDLAPIGNLGATAELPAQWPASPDPLAGATVLAAADPMGGGGSADPMGGGSLGGNPMGGAAAPADPLGGLASPSAPPLQTVSGKPAPLVGNATTVQLGAWDSFFFNAGIGGALQGQLTSRRVWNGNNRQAYPFTYPNGTVVSAENFTFQPGFRIDTEFGYNFYEWLGVGLQTGIIYNGLNQYNVSIVRFPPGANLPTGSYNTSANGELMQVPVQINAFLRWPGDVAFRPFVGGGVGAIWQQLDVNNYYFANTDVQGNFCRSGFQFGWNAQFGATYTVEPGVDFYGAFKMLSAFMPVIGNYQFEHTYNFAVEVGIQSRF